MTLFTLEGGPSVVADVANALLPHLCAQTWVFLEGDLGAGKTTFTQTLLELLGAQDAARSPTFSILDVAVLSPPWHGVTRVLHLDLYRIVSGRELCYLGLEQEFTAHSLALFEWASQVDREDWTTFMATTGCRPPKRVFELTISRVQDLPGERHYLLTRRPNGLF